MGGGKYILVVDDETDIRESIQEILESEGLEVQSAANGLEALKILKSNSAPRLILLDLLMPVMNGLEFRKRQVMDSQISKLPVVVMSADNSARERAAEMHVDFLKKPIELNELISIVRRFY